MYSCLVLCFILVGPSVSTGQKCVPQETSDFQFVIISQRNQTGHWIAQVQLGHEGGEKNPGPYEVFVDHKTTKCARNESVLLNLKVIAPSQGSNIPPDYELIPQFGHYKFHTDVSTWQGAKSICEEEGAHLMIINSEKEAKAMSRFWEKHPIIPGAILGGYAFIGIYSPKNNTEYVTVYNEPVSDTGYNVWNSGEPNGGDHNCGLLRAKGNVLVDYTCNSKNAFICEIELN